MPPRWAKSLFMNKNPCFLKLCTNILLTGTLQKTTVEQHHLCRFILFWQPSPGVEFIFFSDRLTGWQLQIPADGWEDGVMLTNLTALLSPDCFKKCLLIVRVEIFVAALHFQKRQQCGRSRSQCVCFMLTWRVKMWDIGGRYWNHKQKSQGRF